MKRAKRIFEKEGITVQAFPVDFQSSKSIKSILFNPVEWIPNSHSLFKSSFAVRELIGRIVYRIWLR